MAEVLHPLTSQKHRFTFKFCIQSLKLTFKEGVVCTSTPVAITLTKKGQAITTDYAPLIKQGEQYNIVKSEDVEICNMLSL